MASGAGSTAAAGSSRIESLAHQLCVYQTLLMNELHLRTQDRYQQGDSACENSMQALCQSLDTGDGAGRNRGHSSASSSSSGRLEWKLLGFQEGATPDQLFKPSRPPGILALDAMVHFAKNQKAEYHKLVLDQMSREEAYQCPFIHAGLVSTTRD